MTNVALQPALNLLDGLHPAQRDAVTCTGGPLLIIAGAGTGKTTVITHRIAHLIASKQARPNEILALTFTDKAAREMEERVDRLVPYGYVQTWIATFHAFGDRILRDHALFLGRSAGMQVLSRLQQHVFLGQHLFELPFDQLRPTGQPTKHLDALITLFARAKDEDVTPEEYTAYAARLTAEADASGDPTGQLVARRQRELAGLYAAHEALLRGADRLDFGDQIALVLALFRSHPDVLERYRRQFRYILVDEFQDTNYAQFELVKLLAPAQAELTIVADDDQSIYKFRGAAVSNILNFLRSYPAARQVVLADNFRSTQPILDAAYRLIRHNDPERLEVQRGIDKRLVAARETVDDEPPTFSLHDTVYSEAEWVAARILELTSDGSRRLRDCAILVRSNKEAEPFVQTLAYRGIAWQFPGMAGLVFRTEVRLLLAALRVLGDPLDSISWFHVAASDLYRVPMADLVLCNRAAQRANRGLSEVFRAPETWQLMLSDEGRARIQRLLDDVAQLTEQSRDWTPGQLLYRWLSQAGGRNYLRELADPQRADQLRSVAAFFERLRAIESQMTYVRLPELLAHAEWLKQFSEDPAANEVTWDDDAVQILTVHKAKGLEFPVVFLVGLVQGRFPVHARRDALELPDALIKDLLPAGDVHLQEERRLFYVGMTRARDRLYLTAAHDYGGKSVRKVSQFVLEALALPPPPAPPRAHPQTIIGRAQPPPVRRAPASEPPVVGTLRVDPHGIDDYLTCPRKYHFSHELRVPIMRHHLVIFGSALHRAVEELLRAKQAGRLMPLEELWRHFTSAWSNEGFLTREHEELRFAQGKAALQLVWEREQRSTDVPTLIEERFTCRLLPEDVQLSGRWDRVDGQGAEAVIIDYKSSDVQSQTEADARVKRSVQMGLYALAWQQLHGTSAVRVQLRFVESGVTGEAVLELPALVKWRDQLMAAAAGIRQRQFAAQPEPQRCQWCAYQAICPDAYRERP